jgi:hypothetical protein
MVLFDEKDRFEFQDAEHGVTIFEFFDSNAQNRVKEVRDVLNDWFSRYPDSHKIDLKQGFKNNFYTAMYELFIHELFMKQGFELFPHPTIPNSSKRPDFLAVKGSTEFYIEATVLTGVSEEESKKQNFLDNLINQLQKIDSPNCWLVLYGVKFKTANQPATKKIKKAIEEKLAEIDPDKLAEVLTRNPIGFKKFNYEDENVKIELAALPKSEEARGNKGIRPIGLQYAGVTLSSADSDSDLIKESFKGKATRYGKLDKPFLICINLDNLKFNLNHDVTWAFMDDGFFSLITPKFTRTSGVFVTRFNPSNLFTSPHRLIVHPLAQNKLDIESILLTHEIPNVSDSTLIEKLNVEAILKS